MPAPPSHGILNPRGGEAHFSLARSAPAADLRPFVERYWTVRWDLRGRAPHEQETLPWPCVNLVIGTHRPGLFGVCRTRFVAHLEEGLRMRELGRTKVLSDWIYETLFGGVLELQGSRFR